MKKMMMTMMAVSALCLSAANAKTDKPLKPVALNDVLDNAWSADKEQSIHSVKMVYKVTVKGDSVNLLLVRAKKGDKVRFDIIAKDGLYTACRNKDMFWGYDDQSGTGVMDKEDAQRMRQDISFFPIPFDRHPSYNDLMPHGTAYFRSTKCDTFMSTPVENPEEKTLFWIDEKTKLLCVVKVRDETGVYATSFRNYKDFDGVQLPARVQMSIPQAVVTLRLYGIEWNPDLPDELFAKHDPVKDTDIARLRKEVLLLKDPKKGPTPQEKAAAAAAQASQKAQENKAAKLAAIDKALAAVDKEIRDLTIKIEAGQKRLAQLESIYQQDRAVAIEAEKESSQRTRFRYRRAWRYGSVVWNKSIGGGRAKRRLARKMEQEGRAVVSEYERLSSQLTDMQIRLGDAQASKERLQQRKTALM